MLKREDFTPQRIDQIIAEARKHGPYHALTHEERAENRLQFLGQKEKHPQDRQGKQQGLWVFGYGSLLWNPAFEFEQSRPARLFGYRRRFCLSLTMGRGSPDKPGLMLALDTGGSCNGRAFYIPEELVESETTILWMREMLTGAYKPKWCRLQSDGHMFTGMTFVVNRDHPRYVQQMSREETLQRIARGEGYLGSCRQYLENTVAHLDEINVVDSYLHELLRDLEESGVERKLINELSQANGT
ncbi:gamma-glutamylcyclotransferase [Sneathiella chinensis]|uniref:glutathione-specific gamma-glutamylcyclotransferase n=1 Tax=Sneathiella chinensis TaxID=349750 RepID=A0ABQ5U2Y4_9PROT|nr:gamma-glutamylcyclotransferase [Sneathiella chinensis]GLQ05712.1 hypothetical protein GCM10007924_09330 [Sneathiella chinensis]